MSLPIVYKVQVGQIVFYSKTMEEGVVLKVLPRSRIRVQFNDGPMDISICNISL